jgi:hypothetical protein
MASDDRKVTARRTIEQAIHCLTEAKSVIENGEDIRCAVDDVWQAAELIKIKIYPDLDGLKQEQLDID